LSYLVDLCVGLLRQIEGPVGDVEECKNGGKNYAGKYVDLFGARRELVEPGLEEVFALARLHVDLALVDVAHQQGVVVAHARHIVAAAVVRRRRWAGVIIARVMIDAGTASHQRFLKERN
jgi:hypothetical protein